MIDSCHSFFFTIHHWGKWITFSEGDLVRTRDNSKIGTILKQRRTCEKCGKAELSIQSVEIPGA